MQRGLSQTSFDMAPPTRAPVAWNILWALATAKVALHALSNGPLAWGYMTDELYFLDSSARLQWGYVDHPPLSVAVLALLRHLTGDGIFAIRVLPALLGAATIVLTGLLTREMGGRRTAQALAGLAALATPVMLAMSSYYSMNAFEELFWPLAVLLLLRLLNGGNPRLWLGLGAVLALGLLTKVSTLWLCAGIAVGIVMTPARRWLATPGPWLAAFIALAGLAPFVLWNWQHGWPFLEFSRNAATYKVGRVGIADFAAQQAMAMGFAVAPLWLAGLVFVFTAAAARRYRAVAWIFITAAAILALSGSARPHYLAPAFPIAFAAGALLCERLAQRWHWVPRSVAATLLITLAIATPITMPLLPPDLTVRYIEALGLRPPDERERGGLLPMHLGLYFHAEAVLAPLAAVYESLPAEERARVEILTGSFGETGAVNVLGRRRGLPASIGRHNQYGLWGPGAARGELMLVSSADPAELNTWFTSCERRAEIECPFCMEMMDAQGIYLCRAPRRPLADLWPRIRFYR